MNSITPQAKRAERALYRLDNSGRAVSLKAKQKLADAAYRGGSRAIMVMCYANGQTNGRAPLPFANPVALMGHMLSKPTA